MSPFSHPVWWRYRKLVLNAFILVHLCLALAWLFSYTEEQKDLIQGLVADYVIFAGLDQNWSMFAPPRHFNLHMDAVVTYADGTTSLWLYPRMERLGYVERIFKERYRKFGYDNLLDETCRFALTDVAHFIARDSNHVPANPPVLVTIIYFQGQIDPPWQDLGKDSPPQTEIMPIISVPIGKADLK